MYTEEVIYSSARLRENRIIMLRTEAFSPLEFIKNTLISFKESASELKNYLSILQGFKGDDKSLSAIRSSIGKAKDLEGFNFVAHSNMLVGCPTGFKGDYLEYCMVLNENITPLLSDTLKEINTFSIELSQFISNKGVKISMRDDKAMNKLSVDTRIKRSKVLEAFFNTGSNQRLKLGNMFANRSAIVSASVNALQAYEKAYNANPKSIKSEVDTIVQKVQVIIDQAEGHPDVEVSQEAMRNLAEKAYVLGRQIELFALYSTQSETAAVMASYVLDRVIPLIDK